MSYIDILLDVEIKQKIFKGGTPYRIADIPKDRWELVAVGYEQDTPVSYLIAVIVGRKAELYFFSDRAFVDVEVSIGRHHFHISRLAAKPLDYAKALDVDEFWIVTSRNLDLVHLRLPEWTIAERTENTVRAFLKVR